MHAQAAHSPQRDSARSVDVERRQASTSRTIGLTLKTVANPADKTAPLRSAGTARKRAPLPLRGTYAYETQILYLCSFACS